MLLQGNAVELTHILSPYSFTCEAHSSKNMELKAWFKL